jgi:hypothetical protein
MVKRSHLEDTLFAQFITPHLQYDANRLEYENTPDEGEQELLFDDYGNGPDGPAEGEGAYVSHEHFSGMRVVPEETDAGANHGAAEDRDFAHHGHPLQFEIVGEDSVSADVREHGERGGGDDGATDGQPIQPIGEIHRVARANDDERDKENEGQESYDPEMRNRAQKMDGQVGAKALEKRHHEMSGVHALTAHGKQRQGDRNCGDDLQAHLLRRSQAEIATVDDLDEIIGKSNRGEGQGGTHDQPHERIGEVAPQDGRQEDGNANEHSTHGWGAGFFLVIFRTLFADVLADLKFAQLLNYEWPDEQSDQHRGEAGKRSAEGQIAEDAERPEVGEEFLIKQPVKQNFLHIPIKDDPWLSYKPERACLCRHFSPNQWGQPAQQDWASK